MTNSESNSLIVRLARFAKSGRLNAGIVMSAMQELVQDEFGGDSVAALIKSLEAEGGDVRELIGHLREVQKRECGRMRSRLKAGESISEDMKFYLGTLPPDLKVGWDTGSEVLSALTESVELIGDHLFLGREDVAVPIIRKKVSERWEASGAKARTLISRKGGDFLSDLVCKFEELDTNEAEQLRDVAADLRSCIADGQVQQQSILDEVIYSVDKPLPEVVSDEIALPELERAIGAADNEIQRQHHIDLLLSYRSARAGEVIDRVVQGTADRERALLIFALRFGLQTGCLWSNWQLFLKQQNSLVEDNDANWMSYARRYPAEVLLIWYSGLEDAESKTVRFLEKQVREIPRKSVFIDRWADQLSKEEWNELDPESTARVLDLKLQETLISIDALGYEGEPPPLPKSFGKRETGDKAKPVEEKASIAVSKKPSFWDAHVQPLITENWYVVAGIAMVIVGVSLLAYYTWDKAWWVRYAIMPAVLGAFMWALAGVANWIERKGGEFQSMAGILRGAAIGLLPLNFTVVAILAGDERVPNRTFLALLMASVYLIVFGRGVLRCCSSADPQLRGLLGGTVMLVSGLVILAPLSSLILNLSGPGHAALIGFGFYFAFAVVAWAVVRFMRDFQTIDSVNQKRISWFFGSVLGATYFQVFAWVHWMAEFTPQASIYSILVIMSGWLVLFVERRNLILFSQEGTHRAESFMGFALILLGILLGAGHPLLRTVSFLFGGGVWLYQASFRKDVLHYWIGLTLLALGAASIALLDRFPREWMAGVGLGTGAVLGVSRLVVRGRGQIRLADACAGMRMIVLLLTSVVAVLAQWHFRSEPLITGAFLIFIACDFVRSGLRENRLAWIHTAMMILAMSLPFLGFVDLEQRTYYGNTMVFGLAILSFVWFAMIGVTHRPLLIEARSTVLWLYGSLAVVGMLVRVVLEQGAAINPQWYLDYMDYTGPLLMTAVLVFATYYSRSLVPALMAVLITVILFPELKANLKHTMVNIMWESGIGSAGSSVGLMILCFVLRRWSFLRNMPGGDRLFGKQYFPLRRTDHTLFTWPILATVGFLVIKVDTWNLVKNISLDGIPLQTALAVCLTSVTLTMFGGYQAREKGAKWGTLAGAMLLFLGFSLINLSQEEQWHWAWTVLATGLILQGAWFGYRYLLNEKDWAENVLISPTRQFLYSGSVAAVLMLGLNIFFSTEMTPFIWLGTFLIAQMLWHGLERKRPFFGRSIYALSVVIGLAVTHPGSEILLARLHPESVVKVILYLNVFVMLMVCFARRWQSIASPLQVCATGSTLLLGIGLLGNTFLFGWFDMAGIWGVALSALLIAGGINMSMPFVTMAMLLTYALVLAPSVDGALSPAFLINAMSIPWKVSVLALCMVVSLRSGQSLIKRHASGILDRRFGHPFFRAPDTQWVEAPAVVFACLVTLLFSFSSEYRDVNIQTMTPFIAALTLGWVGWFRRQGGYYCVAIGLLFIGNLHLVRNFLGESLRFYGLSELHIICLGIGVSLGQIALVRRHIREENGGALFNQSGLVMAGFVLMFLSANYFTHPDLNTITNGRFLFSGTMALLTGWYFRRAALHPGSGEAAHVGLSHGLYHFGVVLAIWCAALLLPFMRNPSITLVALAIPVVYFYLRAEFGLRVADTRGINYRHSATVIGFLILALYTFRGAFQMLFFPDVRIDLNHYHNNAPLVFVLGLVLMRLHGLGGTSWLAFYGGLGMMIGSYFLLTWYPDLSPFRNSLAAAWAAIVLGFFWFAVSVTRSPLRTLIQQIAALDDPSWFSVRRSWGVVLSVAVHVAVLPAILGFRSHPEMVALLLLGTGSLLIAQGVARKSVTYFALASVELLFALHGDFLVASYIAKAYVVWVVLLIWLATLVLHEWKPSMLPLSAMGYLASGAAALAMIHVLFYHYPTSVIGLWVVALGAVLAALNPQLTREAGSWEEKGFSAALLFVPVWLMYFGLLHFSGNLIETRTLLLTIFTLFATGCFARWYQVRLAAGFNIGERRRTRLFDQTLFWLEESGWRICLVLSVVSMGLGGVVQLAHYSSPFTGFELSLILALYAGLTVAWYELSRRSESLLPAYLMQACVLAFFIAVRRYLMLATGFWNYEYDVWAAVAVSYCLAGLKQMIDLQPRKTRLPMISTMVILPLVACAWVMIHNLGTDAALLVVGLYSLKFAFMGKDNRESPYNAIAIFGFVAFVLISFWSKFEIRYVHAYILPVGSAVLVLLALFGRHIEAATRNRIRFATLITMVGSSGYYALADQNLEIIFNLILIGLCVLSMLFGSFFRIRLYLSIGLVGLLVDLVSIVTKVMFHMERNSRMTIIGSLVLLIGAGLVFGAIYYKTHREMLNVRVNGMRQKFGAWE